MIPLWISGSRHQSISPNLARDGSPRIAPWRAQARRKAEVYVVLYACLMKCKGWWCFVQGIVFHFSLASCRIELCVCVSELIVDQLVLELRRARLDLLTSSIQGLWDPPRPLQPIYNPSFGARLWQGIPCQPRNVVAQLEHHASQQRTRYPHRNFFLLLLLFVVVWSNTSVRIDHSIFITPISLVIREHTKMRNFSSSRGNAIHIVSPYFSLFGFQGSMLACEPKELPAPSRSYKALHISSTPTL